MYRDEVLTEVWRHRDAYVAQHHHDLAEIVDDLKQRQANPHGKLVDRRLNNAPQQMTDHCD